MGDRALIVFHDKTENRTSPVIYLHWHGHKVAEWLAELRERMATRGPDLSYAAARFVGICHTHIDGGLSLGMWEGGADVLADAKDASHGDHGVIIVDVQDGYSFEQHGEYDSCRLEGRTN